MDIETARCLWDRIAICGEPQPHGLPMDIVADMLSKGMISSEREAYDVIETWADMGRYDYGVSLRTGWREPDAEFPGYQDLVEYIQVLTSLSRGGDD